MRSGKNIRKRRRKLKVGRWIFLVMVFSVLGNYLWRVVSSQDILKLEGENIKVSGNSMVSRNMILSRLDPVLGENILKINLREIENDLAGAFPRIRKAALSREYPGGLKILIEEVEPAGYFIESGARHVVADCGRSFPGVEGPEVMFKTRDTEKIKELSRLLAFIREADSRFYGEITAVDMSYRNEVIIYTNGFYYMWHAADFLDRDTVKRNIFLAGQVRSRHLQNNKDISYIDMRFLEYNDDGVSGSVIVK